MALLENTNPAALLIAVILALLTMILATPLPSAAQQETPSHRPQTPPQSKATPRPNPDASGIYHVGDGVTAPKLIYSVAPEFSEKARKRKLAGATTLSFIVETDGHVRDIRVTKSCADAFNDKKDREAALTLDQQASRQPVNTRFEPAQYKGKPVPVELSVEINFQVSLTRISLYSSSFPSSP